MSRPPLDQGLFRVTRGGLSDTERREILQAAAGDKVSRLIAHSAKLERLRALGKQFGFAVVAGRRSYANAPDRGKGGFSNSLARAVSSDSERFGFAYLASNPDSAEDAREAEESSDPERFGALLGIPACCRAAYRRFLPLAEASQGDLLPQVWAESRPEAPFDAWVNIAVRYFGCCLISFFPCSFHCAAARSQAQDNWRRMLACDADWAEGFRRAHAAQVLYSEHQGVHAVFRPETDKLICYGADDWISTERTGLSNLLRRGDRLTIVGPNEVQVHRDNTDVGRASGLGLLVCRFTFLPEGMPGRFAACDE